MKYITKCWVMIGLLINIGLTLILYKKIDLIEQTTIISKALLTLLLTILGIVYLIDMYVDKDKELLKK